VSRRVLDQRLPRDERGFFLETFQQTRYAEIGLAREFLQDNHSRSGRGVLRGIHLQRAPYAQAKLIRCARGNIFDVAVDLRLDSSSFGRWQGEELSDENLGQLFIPEGFGHGFLVLSEWADVEYKTTAVYDAAAEVCLRWDDPDIGIVWPGVKPLVSAKDQAGVSLSDARERLQSGCG